MLNNLYSFSKKAWHVKLFKWIYNTDPTKTFNTMCPYFWSYVVTAFIFPLILIIKLFGKVGTEFLSKLESYKRDKRAKTITEFVTKCNVEILSNKEKYELVKSKCWDNYSYELGYDLASKLNEGFWDHKQYLETLRDEKSIRNERRINEVKESKYFIYSSYIVTLFIFLLLGYTVSLLISTYEFLPVDWERVITSSIAIGIIISNALIIIGFCKYLLPLITDYLKCTNCIVCKWRLWGYIFRPFVLLFKLIVLIGNMIYMTYKKACPIVTWKDE